MKNLILAIIAFTLLVLPLADSAQASTEQQKQAAIEAGLIWLAQTQATSGDQGYWIYANDGTLATTAAAALAFVEEGWLPGVDFEMDGINYGDVVGRAVRYMLNRAAVDSRFGVETAGYIRYAEDYNNDGDFANDGGNNQAIFFNVGVPNRNVYTTGICTPTIYALGERLGPNTLIGMGSAAVSGLTWAQLMQDLVDWFSWAQVEPNRGSYRGGWRYDANYTSSDNSTAQWGALPYLYANDWGLGAPQYVRDELELWADFVQNDTSGGSGYDNPTRYVNQAKTGGLLLEFAVVGRPVSHLSVQAAIGYINNQWLTIPSGVWYGNFNHPYAMWAVYKGLSVYGLTDAVFSLGDPILVGTGIPAAIGGYTIGFDEDPLASAEDDWYSHYCQYLVDIQNANGSWNGYEYWTGPLATAWYINILNATEVPPIDDLDVFVDIKPTSCPNPVNAKGEGVLPVAILGTDEVDVTLIDPASIRLQGVMPLTVDLPLPVLFGEEDLENSFVSPVRTALEDVATPYEGEFLDCNSCTTEGPDGFTDLTMKFYTQEVVAAIMAMLPPDVVLTKKFCVELELTFQINGIDYSAKDVLLLMHADLPAEESAVSALGIAVISPNPFNPITKIEYILDRDGPVELSIYNVAGQKVRTLVVQQQTAGRHSLTWDASRQPSGVYFLRMQASGQSFVQRVTLLK